MKFIDCDYSTSSHDCLFEMPFDEVCELLYVLDKAEEQGVFRLDDGSVIDRLHTIVYEAFDEVYTK